MQVALQYAASAVLSLLLVLFGFMWKRISQNEARIHRIEEVISELSNSVQHRLTGVETDLKWIKEAQKNLGQALERIEELIRKEGD